LTLVETSNRWIRPPKGEAGQQTEKNGKITLKLQKNVFLVTPLGQGTARGITRFKGMWRNNLTLLGGEAPESLSHY